MIEMVEEATVVIGMVEEISEDHQVQAEEATTAEEEIAIPVGETRMDTEEARVIAEITIEEDDVIKF